MPCFNASKYNFSCVIGDVLTDNFPLNLILDIGLSNLNGYLIGKLAIDITIQKQGYGKYLLFSALEKIKYSMSKTGGAFVGVDTLSTEAKQFYQKYGFRESKNNSNFLYITKTDLTNS